MYLLSIIKSFVKCLTMISLNSYLLISFKHYSSGTINLNSLLYRSVLCMAKQKSFSETFYCENCGTEHIKWVGRCTSCKEWNSIKMIKYQKNADMLQNKKRIKDTEGTTIDINNIQSKFNGNSWVSENLSLTKLKDIDCDIAVQRIQLFSSELNRVLGGGLVRSSVILLAGEPGIGKSTLILQLAESIAQQKKKVVYVSGEETAQQIALRAQRLSMDVDNIYLICDTNVDSIIENTISGMSDQPALLIVDSIQTMQCADSDTSPGSVTQIRQCTSKLLQVAKATGVIVILVGHVTKSGDVAGPRVLEHMVDTVLYVEGIEKAEYRLVRSMKNRFGSVAEVGIFVMTSQGLMDVANPSELFMSSAVLSDGMEGSAVAIVMEGTRPILAEIQCLVGGKKQFSETGNMSPRRAVDGFPIQRLLLILAIIEKRLRLPLWNRDVYLNVVGGLKISEPLSDLAVAVTVISSLTNLKVRAFTTFIGELGLGGEMRSGRSTELRIAEAIKLGFKRIVLPKTSGLQVLQDRFGDSLQLLPCATLKEALSVGLDTGLLSFESLMASRKQSRSASSSSKHQRRSENDVDDDISDVDTEMMGIDY